MYQKRRKTNKVYPKIIQVDENLVYLLSRKLVNPKYGDPESPLITILIGIVKIHNVLVDLGTAINVIIVEISKNLVLFRMHPTTIIL